MSYINTDIQIDGSVAELADFSETYAVVQGLDRDFSNGEGCHLTIFFNLMGRRVPVKLDGEVVRKHDGEIMFSPPTYNWQHIVRALKGHRSLLAA